MLRGACALTVFLNHWPLWSNFAPAGELETGVRTLLDGIYRVFIQLTWPTGGQHPALIGFFVLSGFCVHLPFERKIGLREWQPDWRGYLRRRFWRIMPVYWVGVGLGLLAVTAEHWRPTGDGLLALHTTASPWQVAARLGGWAGVWPEEIFAGNYILHTVGSEIVIYAVYPLFFVAAAAGRWWLLGLGALGLQLLALPLMQVVDPFVIFPSVVMMGLFWYFGALAAHLHVRRAWTVPGWWLGALWAGFLLLQRTPHFFGLNMIKQLIWGLLCTLVVVWLVGWESRHASARGRIGSRFLCWTGDISYPLYAVHTPVILLTNWALLVFGTGRSYGLQLALNLMVPLVVTLVVHHSIEKRLYRPRGTA